MLGLGNYESSTQHRPKDASAVRDTVPDRELSGPVLGPMHDMGPSQTSDGRPLSNRTLIHDLTLPPVPNLDIPPSPPGSPNPAANAKFEHFLSLKKQGIHFNDKLANSISLKNPSLLSQMMQHAGIDDRAQYSSSLPTEMWNTSNLPSWGYKEELLKAQRELNAKADETRAKGQRDTIEFPRDDVYGQYDSSYLQTTGPKTHTQSPAVTGTSVIAVKFNGGVAIAADNLASYGSLARFTDVKRLRKFGDAAVIGFSGDVSDMQYIDRLLESIDIRENYSVHGNQLNAKNLHTYLSKVFYKRRSDFNPLWNHILVAGFDSEKKPFLSSADLLGTTFSAPHLATGFGAHLAIPILRRLFPEERPIEEISKEDAVSALKDCLKVLWYRDARSMDKYSLALITQEGIEMYEDQQVEAQNWAFAESIKGYGAQAV
ncbi:nucleophile aminohydrolase [Aspergillus nidulans var. acristatus]